MADVTSNPIVSKKAGGVSLLVAYNAVRRYPVTFFATLLLSATASAAVWLFMPLPKNTASVVFHLAVNAPRIISPTSENQVDLRSYRALQIATVTRRVVLNAALNRPEMATVTSFNGGSKTIDALDRILKFDTKTGPEFFRVYIEGDQPADMLATLKAVKEAYMADLDQREYGTRTDRLKAIEESIALQKAEISSKEKRIGDITSLLTTGDSATLLLMDTLLQDDFRTARRASMDLQQELELAKAELPPENPKEPDTVPPAFLDAAVRRNPALATADALVLAAKEAAAAVRGRFEPGTQNALVENALAAVKAAEDKRDRLRDDLRKRLAAGALEDLKAETAARASKLKERIERLEFQKQQADGRVKNALDNIQKHGQYRLELETLRKDIGHQDKLLTTMAEERERIRIEKQAPSRVSVAEEPFVVAGVEGSRRLKMAGLVGGGLFVFGFVAIVWWEHRARRVTRSEDVTQALDLPLLGTLPAISGLSQPSQGDLIESIDAARTLLLRQITPDRPLRTVMVTSALPGEGKSTLSGHIAISLARGGYRVLLVDGDIHRPSLHKLFDLQAAPGLCDELTDDETLSGIPTQPTPVPNLSLLSAGAWTLNVRGALAGGKWASLRVRLEGLFDFVVVDTGPLLLVNDTQLLAQSVDGIVLAVLVGVSKHKSTSDAKDLLHAIGGRILGVVVNGVKSAYSYSYYRNYTRTAEADVIPLNNTADGLTDAKPV